MSKAALFTLIRPLHFKMRQEIEGYIITLEHAAVDIFRDAEVQYSDERLDRFLFLSGVKRLWTLVDTQFWVLENSIKLARSQGVESVSIGSNAYSKQSSDYREVKKLRTDLAAKLAELKLFPYMETNSPRDLMRLLQ